MAIAYMQVAVVSRSQGQSSGASAAYITGEAISITSTKTVSYYVPDDRVQHTEVIGANMTHQQLWDGVESHHKRGDALTAYKMTLALPHELPEKERIELARQFTQTLTGTYGVAASLAVHTSPGKDGNWHAHIQWTSVSVDKETGKLGKKVNDLDPIWCKRNGKPVAVETMRATWATLANEFGTRRGVNLAIDMRSYKRQGSAKIGQLHEGWDNNKESKAEINKEIRAYNAALVERAAQQDAKYRAAMADFARQKVEEPKRESPSDVYNRMLSLGGGTPAVIGRLISTNDPSVCRIGIEQLEKREKAIRAQAEETKVAEYNELMKKVDAVYKKVQQEYKAWMKAEPYERPPKKLLERSEDHQRRCDDAKKQYEQKLSRVINSIVKEFSTQAGLPDFNQRTKDGGEYEQWLNWGGDAPAIRRIRSDAQRTVLVDPELRSRLRDIAERPEREAQARERPQTQDRDIDRSGGRGR